MADIGKPDIADESFEESVQNIADTIRPKEDVAREASEEKDFEEKKLRDLERIKAELKKTYAAGSGPRDPKDPIIPPQTEKIEQDDYLAGIEEEHRDTVETLVQQAVVDGIAAAVTAAQKNNNPYITDAFHDSLTYFLHQKIQNEGALEESGSSSKAKIYGIVAAILGALLLALMLIIP